MCVSLAPLVLSTSDFIRGDHKVFCFTRDDEFYVVAFFVIQSSHRFISVQSTYHSHLCHPNRNNEQRRIPKHKQIDNKNTLTRARTQQSANTLSLSFSFS